MLDRIYSSLKEKNPELMARETLQAETTSNHEDWYKKVYVGELSRNLARPSSVSRTTYTNILSQNLVQLDQQMERGA